MSINKGVKETSSIAEKVLEAMHLTRPEPVLKESRKLGFRKSFALRRNVGAKMLTGFSITDDSGFIPFEKEIERFEASGEVYKKYMRMAFPNGSADKVVSDYESSFGSMSRLDAINFVKSHSVELQNRLNVRASDARAKMSDSAPIEVKVVNQQVNQPTEPEAPKA